MTKPLKFTSWSWSRYSDYKLCPLKASLAHLEKIREPKNDAMERGALIHDQARDYIKGVLKKLPSALSLPLVRDELNFLKKEFKKKVLGAIVEEDWVFKNDWTQTQWNDWAGAYLRVKLDAGHFEDTETFVLTDWKTGKFRAELHSEYVEQLELYALAALVLLPHVNKVKPRLVYTDVGSTFPSTMDDPVIFTRHDIIRLKKAWENRTKKMMRDSQFKPTPNDKCKWCFYGQSGKSRGGPGRCKF